MIELNRKYTGKQLAAELFEVSDGTFRTHKQNYLNYMSEFFEWHKEGSKYVFTAQLKEYVPKAKGRKTTKEQASVDYENAMYELLTEEPWNTGAGIARDITLNNQYMITTYHHRPRTAYNYVLPIAKEKYDITDRQWRAFSGGSYDPMSEEHVKEWKALMNACFGNNKDVSLEQDLAILKDSGDISDEEYKETLAKINDNKYQAALEMWHLKYGYKPIRVNKYQLKMLKED